MIERIIIENYKSIRKMDLNLGPINILIGANGAGKSNFISFFEMTSSVLNGNIESYSKLRIGSTLMFQGPKRSSYIGGLIDFDNSKVYNFKLILRNDESLELNQAGFRLNAYNKTNKDYDSWPVSDNGHKLKKSIEELTADYANSFQVYHFHDTGSSSPLKQTGPIDDNYFLRPNGANLAAFLYFLKEKHELHFQRIQSAVRSIAPFFEKFDLKPRNLNPDQIKLEWKEKESDMYLDAHQLSDGTLRFIALATLLLQPNPPKTIIIDEPELGLHPFAIHKLGALLKKVSVTSQVIVSTQSVELLNEFEPEDIITVDRKEGNSVFNRLDEVRLSHWLDEFSLGDIWQRNIIGGQP